MQTIVPERRTLDIPTFAKWLGVSPSHAYEEARKGNIAGVPVLRVGKRMVVSREVAERVLAHGTDNRDAMDVVLT